MNAASDYPLIDRYLDGLTTQDEAAAVVEAVESDPDALAWLRQAAEIEAGLQFHLAGSSRPRRTPLRIIPFWHWRRAGKWCATGAAVAALAACAAVLFWPHGGTGTGLHELGSSMTVKRFAPGERSGAPLQAPEPAAHGAMEEVEFRPGPRWLQLLRSTRISEPGDETSALPITEDQYLERYLRAAGVTFPDGAGLYWVLDKPAFVAVNTAENIAWITAMGEDPDARGPRLIELETNLWKFPSQAQIAPILATERLVTPNDRKSPRPESDQIFNSSPALNPGFHYTSVQDKRAEADIHVTGYRAADFVHLAGLSGTAPADGVNSKTGGKINSVEDFADTEFDLMLASGEEAVIHLGIKPDGNFWVMTMQARLVPLPVEIRLDSVPNVMQSDPKLLEVKAGAPVRLSHRNTACVLQHNFVLVKTGKADAVGALADRLITAPDALSKLYIPESPDIIVTGKKLLALGQSEVIEFTAPSEPGDYPWLCTFPGHWRLQQGILRVVK